MKTGDRIAGIVIIIVGTIVWISSNSLVNRSVGVIDASFFPKLIGILLLVTGGILLLQTFNKNNKENKKQVVLHRKEFVLIGSYIIYIVLIPLLGFLITTPILIIVMAFYLGSKKKMTNILVGILVTAGIYFLFTQLLSVPLPMGSVF